jgi:hypothetical protein
MILVVDLNNKNCGVIMNIRYGYRIRCEVHPFSCTIMCYLINGEYIQREFWNIQDTLKTSMWELYSPLANDLNRGVISHEDGRTIACINKR